MPALQLPACPIIPENEQPRPVAAPTRIRKTSMGVWTGCSERPVEAGMRCLGILREICVKRIRALP